MSSSPNNDSPQKSQPLKLQPVRGTHDWYGPSYRAPHHVMATAFRVAETFGYQPLATPIFEHAAVFTKSLGETTDIIGKEMYLFEDRSGDTLALRPEGTAGAVRAALTLGLFQSLPLKLIYAGPMFRYERPQRGRMRQFHQVGLECFGAANPTLDAEVIACGALVLKTLDLQGKIQLEINTLGDLDSRLQYRQILKDYLTRYKDSLSEDSQLRLEKNPLRILDSKEAKDQEIIQSAPLLWGHLPPSALAYFETLLENLEKLGIPYVKNHKLVRGLDYYTHTAFEFTTQSLGAQGTVLGGGRYDGLVQQMGGPPTPGIGWALGVERLVELLPPLSPRPSPVAFFPISAAEEALSLSLAMTLREAGIPCETFLGGNLGKRLKKAHRNDWAVLLGEDEVKAGKVLVRDLKTGIQIDLEFSKLISFFTSYFTDKC